MARDKRKKLELEDLRGTLRIQSKQIKHLKKELARAGKQAKRNELLTPEHDEPIEFEFTPDEKKYKCPKCGAKAATVELGIRTVVICQNKDCKHRYTKK